MGKLCLFVHEGI